MKETWSFQDERFAAEWPHGVTVTADEATVVSFGATLGFAAEIYGQSLLPVTGIRHGRLGFGLGGGLS